MSAFPVDSIRNAFPALHQRVHGKPLAYLDNAATTQIPKVVDEAMSHLQLCDRANVHRGVHTLSQRATTAYEQVRRLSQAFINAKSEKEIIFVSGTTAAINLVAQTFGKQQLGEGDEIIISTLEHHSNIVPWQLLAAEKRAQIKVIPINNRGELDLVAYERLFSSRTKLVAVGHVSNALGTINPIAAMIGTAHAHGVPILIDGAQAAGHIPVDVQALDCDFYAFSAHKLYGPNGMGVLYAKEQILDTMPPYQGGGDMISSVSFAGTTYNDLPYKFEAGTPNIVGAVGMGAALQYLTGLDLQKIRHYEHELLQYATAALKQVPKLRLVGTAAEKVAIVSFIIEGVHPHDIGTILDQAGVAIRAGHHCAQPLMEALGLTGTARASFAFYNTIAEVDQLVAGLSQVHEVFGL